MSAFDVNGLLARVIAQAKSTKTAHVEMEVAPDSMGDSLTSSVFSGFEVAYSAFLFYKWDASVDSEYAPDPYGEAVNPAQIVAQAKKMIDQYGFESIKLKAGVFPPDEEADAIKALKAAFPSHQLRIDPNGNWSFPTSIRIAKRPAGDLEYDENPTPGLEGMAEVYEETRSLQATNMVVTSWDHSSVFELPDSYS